MSKNRFSLALAFSALACAAACQKPEPEPQPEPAPAPAPCPVQAYSSAIGTNIRDLAVPKSMMFRVVGPDTMVTLDHIPERLNINLDETGTIIGLTCG